MESVGRPHGESECGPEQPDRSDDKAGGSLALLPRQRVEDGLVAVQADRHQRPDRGVHLSQPGTGEVRWLSGTSLNCK